MFWFTITINMGIHHTVLYELYIAKIIQINSRDKYWRDYLHYLPHQISWENLNQ